MQLLLAELAARTSMLSIGTRLPLGPPRLEVRHRQNVRCLAGLRKARTHYARSTQTGDRSAKPQYERKKERKSFIGSAI